MRFLVILPRVAAPSQHYLLPAGMAYIASALRSAGHEVRGLNLNQSTDLAAKVIARAVEGWRPDVIATGGLSAHYRAISYVVQGCRSEVPGVPVILGGGLLSSEPELIMGAMAPDYGVIGEGERTVLQLAECIEGRRRPEEVQGIIYRDAAGTLVRTAAAPAIRDLASLPYPDYGIFDLEGFFAHRLPNDTRGTSVVEQPREMCVVASRSCPYRCTFCYHPIGNVYRERSLDDVVAEVVHWKERYGINMLTILDELFSMKRDRVMEFCRRVAPLDLKWCAQMRVTDLDEETLAAMKASGCWGISYGFESGSDTVLKSMKKHIRAADIERAVEMTFAAGIQVQGNFIFGDVAETASTVTETLSMWLRLRKNQIWMFPIEVYPGTPLYLDAVAKGQIRDPAGYIAAGCPCVNLTAMNDAENLRTHIALLVLSNAYNSTPAEVLRLEEMPDHPLRGRILAMTVRCPHCDTTMEYRNISPQGVAKFSCRACNRRFDVPPFLGSGGPPSSFRLSTGYRFVPEHRDQVEAFIARGEGIRQVSRQTMEIVLLGETYLVPSAIVPRDVRYGLANLYWVAPEGRIQPFHCYNPDDFRALSCERYGGPRWAGILAQAPEGVVLAGPLEETREAWGWAEAGAVQAWFYDPFRGDRPLEPGEIADLAEAPGAAVVCASACGQRAVLDRVASLGREGIPFFDDALLPSLAPVLSGARD